MPRLPITAMSLVGSMGRTTVETLAALDEGRTGLRAPAELDGLTLSLPFPTVVGAVPGALSPLSEGDHAYDTRLARIGMMALAEVRPTLDRAIARWGKRRIAVLIGTSTGGLDATEDAFRSWAETGGPDGGRVPSGYDLRTQHDFNALGELIRRVTGLEGPTHVVSTACSSSGKVHASALRLMQLGLIDAALVGGIDSLCKMTLHGFRGLGILSDTHCKPFARDRAGINIGEGAGFMLLEREDARTHAEALAYLLGVGESSDAYNMSSPEPSGRGAKEAMQRALEAGGITAADVGLLIAHGTATPQNDVAESMAIESVLGPRVPVISTKGYTGHQLGAAGATSAVFAAHAVRTNKIPRSLGAEPNDPAVRVNVLAEGRSEGTVGVALCNAFAFGGSNVCLAIASPDWVRAHAEVGDGGRA
ncbi:MAG: beta-ketoacyl-[acyl-carrier-protein] synthase II [Deltaproteobacteria bacterium]|nr:beta-ketoacyl-[acyl-carrier-protein] synthase II [Deltaproteobacteria bacterium]